MKKIIAFVLSLLMINLSLVSCFKRDREEPEEYSWGDDNITFSFPKTVNALIKSDTNEFDINDVTFDFYYGLYRLDDQTMEEAKKRYSYHDKRLQHSESCFAIYFSKTGMNIFEMGDDYRILDFENVDGQLYKFITCEEAFETDYGFTTYGYTKVINYNHCEKLTIPAEFFVTPNNRIIIYIFRFYHDLDKDAYYLERYLAGESTDIELKYKLNDGKIIILD